MDVAGENERGIHARMLLEGRHDFTLAELVKAAFDPNLPLFKALVPSLAHAYDNAAMNDPLKVELREPIAVLRGWDDRWSADSTATSLAIFWVNRLAHLAGSNKRDALLSMPDAVKLNAFAYAVERLNRDFGTWKTPWGQINRFQRLDDSIKPHFDDQKPSIPVPFVAGIWGSLAGFYADPAPNTKRWYGHSGNSFVAAVEFGGRIRAVAVTAGGESGDPSSPHFDDQATRYASGDLREVYFYPEQLRGHTERSYHPGEL
jgi:acyl-homoserine-lactone acylase